MIRFATALLATTVFCSTAFADGIASHTASGGVATTAPGEGRVPLTINVTETRRVMVRDAAAPSQLRFVCSTPCRLYVQPGNVDITLVGWNSHEYHWDVPAHGGAINLQARPMPADVAAARAAAYRAELAALRADVARAEIEAAAQTERDEDAAHTGMMFGLASVGGVGSGLAQCIAVLDALTDGESL